MVFTVGLTVVQAIVPPAGVVTVQVMEPAGIGEDEREPATRAVRVAEVPRVGVVLSALIAIDGIKVEIPRVTLLEVTAV